MEQELRRLKQRGCFFLSEVLVTVALVVALISQHEKRNLSEGIGGLMLA